MKRADLYQSRRTRPKSISNLRTSRTHTDQNTNTAGSLPLCHWLQLCLCILFLFLMLVIPSLISNENLSELQKDLQQHITHSTDLQHREWHGSLKEILFMEK